MGVGTVATYDAPAMAAHNNLVVTGDGVVIGSGDATIVAIDTDTDTGAVRWSADIAIPGDPSPCLFFAMSEPGGRI